MERFVNDLLDIKLPENEVEVPVKPDLTDKVCQTPASWLTSIGDDKLSQAKAIYEEFIKDHRNFNLQAQDTLA